MAVRLETKPPLGVALGLWLRPGCARFTWLLFYLKLPVNNYDSDSHFRNNQGDVSSGTTRQQRIIKLIKLDANVAPRNAKCSPVNNVVLVKVHKCASSTIANILTRYGMKRHLNFALPRLEIGHIGWPMSLLPEYIEPIGRNRTINIIAHHITYNETTLKKVMPKNTKYFAILREPFSQFRSTLLYFGDEQRQYRFKTKDVVAEFLSNPDFYERKTAFYSNGFTLGRRSMTLNFMSTEFGFDNGWRFDDNKINEFMAYVKEKFDLILIREYMTESIVLMRRLLCWSMEDVVHLIVNRGKHYKQNAAGKSTKDATMYATYKNYSRVDFMMYDYFNTTLWEKMAEQGPDFWSEVGVCTMVNQLITSYCADSSRHPVFVVPDTLWNKKFEFKGEDCPKLTKGPHLFNREIGVMMGLERFKNPNPYARHLLPKNLRPWT
jgi:galactosylceramide sulfotransferase/galactose-3-O-sulfotransferase 3